MSYTIMVIDDEQMILDMLRDQFEMEQYQVITAKSGEEGPAKADPAAGYYSAGHQYAGDDGLELCRAIRDHVTCPILFLTARMRRRIVWLVCGPVVMITF